MKKRNTRPPVGRILYRFISFSEPYRARIVIGIILFMTGDALNRIIWPYWVSQFLDERDGGKADFVIYALLVGGTIALAEICFRIFDYLMATSQSYTMRKLDTDGPRNILRQEHQFHADNHSGSLNEIARRFSESYMGSYDIFVFGFCSTGVIFLGAVIVAFSILWWVGVGLLLWSLIFFATAVGLTLRRDPLYKGATDAKSELRGVVTDVISHAAFVDVSGTRAREVEHIDKAANKLHLSRLARWFDANKQWAIQGFLVAILKISFVTFAAKVSTDIVSTGQLVLLFSSIGWLTHSIWQIAQQYDHFMRHMYDAQDVFQIIDRKEKVQPYKEGVLPKPGIIEIEDVTIVYEKDKTKKIVFEDFSLSIAPGEKVAFVGPSGSGKSTLVNALMRSIDPQSGKISVGGVSSVDVERDLWRRKLFSFVNQNVSLFDRSIRELIAYGDPNATEEEILQASKDACAHEFISELPDGYDSLVGERGIQLSGGQCQRVLLAQAFLKKAPILILDEATSAIDNITERAIKRFLDKLSGTTVIAIAHRLSTVEDFDKIYVIDNGKIVERGTHAELVSANGLYKNLHNEVSTI